jgi:serine-type D-Ala-D-Ala carboxypeptidase/endopeptidase (penicillin-binding protein 4)
VHISKLTVLAFAASLCARSGTPADIAPSLEALLANSPAIQHGRVGFKFVDLASGATIAERDANKFFIPASNTKLYTTALALNRLGADYVFRTELRTPGAFHPGETQVEDLLLVGGGDPNLSGRALPYLRDSPEGDPLAGLKELVEQLHGAGVREIRGDVIAIDTRYPGDMYPDGWTLDDSNYSYGAPVSSVVLNDNTVSVIVRPAKLGAAAQVETRPSRNCFTIHNRVVTDASKKTHIKFRRPPGSEALTIWGTIGHDLDQWREDFAVSDPAMFSARVLRQLLAERGIIVRGRARAQYRDLDNLDANSGTRTNPVESALIVQHESNPLAQLIQVTNKVSQNLYAEMLLREVAFKSTGLGTLENGLKEREAFLREAGVTREGTGFALADGSGLARQDLTTPDSTVALLRYMWTQRDRDSWLQSLPVGSLDGSLQYRFRGIAGAQRVHAKTGSLSHVNALSGYIETQGHGWLAFSVMVNGTIGQDTGVREFIDKLCSVFLNL